MQDTQTQENLQAMSVAEIIEHITPWLEELDRRRTQNKEQLELLKHENREIRKQLAKAKGRKAPRDPEPE